MNSFKQLHNNHVVLLFPPEAVTLVALFLDSKLVAHLDVLEPCMDQLLAIHLLEDG
jgi:hypothetical protein